MSKVAIIGSGFIGRAWAISFSRAGHDIALWDKDEGAADKALTYIEGVLPDLEANDLLNGHSPKAVRGRMRAAATLEEVMKNAAYVQENTPEVVDIVKELPKSARRRVENRLHPGALGIGGAQAFFPNFDIDRLHLVGRRTRQTQGCQQVGDGLRKITDVASGLCCKGRPKINRGQSPFHPVA